MLTAGYAIWYFFAPYYGGRGGILTSSTTASAMMCAMYPDTGEIAVSLKTGATEAMKRLPAILETSLSCVKDVLVFSDLNQTYGNIEIHDVLSRFDPQAMKHNKDFDIYREQQHLQALGREDEIEGLASRPAHAEDWHTASHNAPWALDKYKFLHMLEMAWDLQPNKDWYLFLEPDTYLSWPNLKRWLKTMDSSRKLYTGNALQKSDNRQPLYFAHGGSGFVISGPALKDFAVDHKGIASSLDARMHEWWAGDFTVADAYYDNMGLKVTSGVPMFNQDHSLSVPFSDRQWCHPAITLHHMQAEDFTEMFGLEKKMRFERFLLRDVHDLIYPTGLPSAREDWDNHADAHEYALDGSAKISLGLDGTTSDLDPNGSFDNCRIGCEFNPQCFQFTWRNTTIDVPGEGYRFQHSCVLSSAFRLGHSKPPQDFWARLEEKDTYRAWHSGWLQDRIAAWVQSHPKCPEGDNWVLVDPDRTT